MDNSTGDLVQTILCTNFPKPHFMKPIQFLGWGRTILQVIEPSPFCAPILPSHILWNPSNCLAGSGQLNRLSSSCHFVHEISKNTFSETSPMFWLVLDNATGDPPKFILCTNVSQNTFYETNPISWLEMDSSTGDAAKLILCTNFPKPHFMNLVQFFGWQWTNQQVIQYISFCSRNFQKHILWKKSNCMAGVGQCYRRSTPVLFLHQFSKNTFYETNPISRLEMDNAAGDAAQLILCTKVSKTQSLKPIQFFGWQRTTLQVMQPSSFGAPIFQSDTLWN